MKTKIAFLLLELSVLSVVLSAETPRDEVSPETKTRAIEVDCTRTVRSFSVNPTGLCLSFLNDADNTTKPLLAPVIKSMNISSLRFPEGALGENYLFHDLRKGLPAAGSLQPRAIVKTKMAGGDRWLTPDNNFTHDTLGFDQYIKLCRECGAEPVVTVSAKGHKFRGSDIDEEGLLGNAEEWVRYANVTRQWGVKYWEIGNEVDHEKYQKGLSKDQYMDIYKKMTTRMKAVDPSIHTGLGTGHGPEYAREALKRFPELVDFVVVHKYATEITKYKQYLNSRRAFFTGAAATLKAIDSVAPEARRLQTEILITEFSSFSWVKDPPLPPERKENSIMNALITFEMLAEGASLDDRVCYLHFWVTHNPWQSSDSKNYCNALGPQNEILPQGRAVEIMGRFVLDRMVAVKCPSGPVRCWASATKDGAGAAVWLVNRTQQTQAIHLKINGFSTIKPWKRWALAGAEPNDINPTWGAGTAESMRNGQIMLTIAPLSITVLHCGKE